MITNDEMAKAQIKKIGETYLNAKIQMLEDLLQEIEIECYDRVSQVKGCISSNLDILNKIKNKVDDE